MIRITTLVGARPQFVKAAAISRAFRVEGSVEETLIHTGQHYDPVLSDIFFDELELPRPKHNLGIGAMSHGAMTGRILEAVEGLLVEDRPDAVLVFGDTNSTMGGALAAAKLGIPVIHVEAGMRSGRLYVPEEINRIVTDHLSELLLCSTQQAMVNLQKEGLHHRARMIGDVMYDVTVFAGQKAAKRSGIVERLKLRSGEFDLVTVHRAENTDDPARLSELMAYVAAAARTRPLVFPMHPRTRQALRLGGWSLNGVIVAEPLGYFDFHRLLAECACVHTDSGGVQKEAYFYRKPCVTLRSETEWTETVEAGWNRLWTQKEWRQPRRRIDEYGSGAAAELAVDEIVRFIAGRTKGL